VLQKLRDAARTELQSLHRAEANLSLDAEDQHIGSQLAAMDIDLADAALQHDMRQRLVACTEHFVREHPRAVCQLAALWLKYIDGLDDRAIAKRLGKTVAAVQVLRSRGLARLRSEVLWQQLADELGLQFSSASMMAHEAVVVPAAVG